MLRKINRIIALFLRPKRVRLMNEKLLLLDHAIHYLKIKSFIDLGGVWNVDGGYTFYALEKGTIDHAFLVDTDFTEIVLKRHNRYPQLSIIKSNFGEKTVLDRVKRVDCVLLFDVLLHQVKPDWDEVIKMYAPYTRHFIIYNPQYTKDTTIRLLDLGKKEYFENVPEIYSSNIYTDIFDRLDDIHPTHNREYRDIHNIWQWGISDSDLVKLMEEIGFRNMYYINYGKWGGLKNFEGRSFIFSRSKRDT